MLLVGSRFRNVRINLKTQNPLKHCGHSTFYQKFTLNDSLGKTLSLRLLKCLGMLYDRGKQTPWDETLD